MVGPLKFVVDELETGQRADKIVGAHLPGASRAQVREAFEQGRVRVNGRVTRKGQLLVSGQVVLVSPQQTDSSVLPRPPLTVVHEDAAVVVVNKPAGQPSAPRFSEDAASVASALLEAYPEMKGVGHAPGHAGLLSRLDTDTSGLLLAARTVAAFEQLRAGMSADPAMLHKGYLAIVAGTCDLQPRVIVTQLGAQKHNRRKVTVTGMTRGKTHTVYTRLVNTRRVANFSVVELEVVRAYRHQVRAHLAHLGWPLLGDVLYGGAEHSRLTRHALHAHRIAWAGSDDVPSFAVACDLPADLLSLLGELPR